MDNKLIKGAALLMTVITLVSGMVLFNLSVDFERKREHEKQSKMSGIDLMNYYTSQSQQEEGALEDRMKIAIPDGLAESDITFYNDYLQQLVTITVPGIDEDFFYEYPILGNSSHIDNLMFGSDTGVGVIEITFNEVYEIQYEIEDSYLILSYFRPTEIYDKVIVVDTGHGGSAPGAVKMNIMEKDLNLAIALELKKLLDKLEKEKNIKVYYTRTEDVNPTLDQRVQLANRVHANMFISIHNNSYDDGRMSEHNGTEVMYDEKKEEERLDSKHLSEIMLEEVVKVTGSKDDGLIRGHNIYIIRTSEVPVALVEVGFMTNIEELEKLKNIEYQKKAAKGIYAGILRAFEEGF